VRSGQQDFSARQIHEIIPSLFKVSEFRSRFPKIVFLFILSRAPPLER
jgi:hypothetical protein